MKAALAALEVYTDILADISPAMGRGHARIVRVLVSVMDAKGAV